MSKRAPRPKGREAFEAGYAESWGERWPELLSALQAPVSHVAWWNPHCLLSPNDILPPDAQPSQDIPQVWEASEFAPPPRDSQGLLAYYLLDGASVVAAQELAVEPGHRVLDICAAPGGKSLVLASGLGEAGSLCANERSKGRLHRLRTVLSDYLPPDWPPGLDTSRHDATRWCLHEVEAYDRILLDVPCSSERHLLADPSAMAQWSPARSRQLAVRQYAILASALEVLRVGGELLYSTCSISPLENQQVLEKLLRKRAGRAQLLELQSPLWQDAGLGGWILPDADTPWGPIFAARIKRLS